MQIFHRIGFNPDINDPFFDAIKSLGIKYEVSPLPGRPIGLVTFSISESDDRWTEFHELEKIHNPFDIFETIFSEEEVKSAEWSRLVTNREQGYPQPEGRWEQITYEDECPECGVGYRQIAPFSLKKEPTFRNYDFFCLFWTYTTVFCRKDIPDIFRDNEINGYEICPPLIHSTKQPSENTVQLLFPHITAPGMAEADKVRPETCKTCGLTKYLHHSYGMMKYKRESLAPVDFQMSYEWFGSDTATGYREVIVSNKLARLILAKGWRGVRLKPIETY